MEVAMIEEAKGIAEQPMVLAGPGDSIRIVPLYVPEEVTQLRAGAVPPKLTYRGGPLLSSVQVFTVFWGSAWQHAPETGLVTQINEFFNFILRSPLMDQLSEYNVPGHTIGHGNCIGTATVTSPKLKHSVTDRSIQHMLQ